MKDVFGKVMNFLEGGMEEDDRYDDGYEDDGYDDDRYPEDYGRDTRRHTKRSAHSEPHPRFRGGRDEMPHRNSSYHPDYGYDDYNDEILLATTQAHSERKKTEA
jgi:hypothetical protein